MTQRERRRQDLLRVIRLWMRCRGTWIVLAFSFSLACPQGAFAAVKPLQAKAVKQEAAAQGPAAAEKKKEEKTVLKKMTGTVSFIRKTKMAVEFASRPDEMVEMYLTIDPKVKLSRAKNFSDIAQGDKVEVKFVQTFKEPKKKGDEAVILGNVVTEITLLKKASTMVSEEKAVPA